MLMCNKNDIFSVKEVSMVLLEMYKVNKKTLKSRYQKK